MKPTYDHAISFVWVKDWDRALRFYTDVLGFTKVYESDGWAEFRIPGVKDSYIALNRWVRGEPQPRNEFVTLRVSDLDAFKDYLESKEVHVRTDVDAFMDENQGLRMFKFCDPECNVLTAAQIVA